jgi:superfamily II DNA or RNA helicase
MFELREPQIIYYDKIKKAISNGNKKILVMACTGFGKTILSYEIIKNANLKNNSVLFTSHRIALAEQTRDKFKDIQVDYLQGENNVFNEDYKCLVATLQTLNNTEIKPPKIVIIDEVHYAYESGLVQNLFTRFPNAIFIGLSATPVDNNDYLLDGFDCSIDDYQTEDLIKLGWLVPFKIFAPFTVDTSQVKMKGSDLNDNELEKTINKENINDSIVDNYIKFGEDRKFIVFASNKKHCLDLKNAFNKKEIITEVITADTSSKKRNELLKKYKEGLIQGLISIEILTAGFDEESLSCVIFATKTIQWKKYIQCAGRGIRLHGLTFEESIKNNKPYCILLDFCGNIEYHGLPTDRKIFKVKSKFSKIIDRQLGLNENIERSKEIFKEITEDKKIFLKEIGSLLDLYDGKIYRLESELQEDVNNFLNKTNYFYWRQNSGKMFKDGRWIHFASKNGLPDNTVFYKNSSLFFGLELKLKTGRLTEHQLKTLPEMKSKGVLFFICESVYDVFLAITHIENNIIDNEDYFVVNKEVYKLPEWQINLQNKLRL